MNLLEDDNHNQYELNMEFDGLDQEVTIKSIIYMPDKLVKNNGVYSFGIATDTDLKIDEYIKIIVGNKEYYLQRYYG